MVQRKKTRKSNAPKRGGAKDKTRQEIYIGAGILFIVIMIISLHTDSAGIIGEMLKAATLSLFGIGGYVFPYFLITIALFYFLKKDEFKKNCIALSVIYVSVLGIMDIMLFQYRGDMRGLVEVVKSASEIGRTGFGGGVAGAVVSFIGRKLLGPTGTVFLQLFMIAGAVLVVSNRNLSSVIRSFFLFVRGVYARSRHVIKDLSESPKSPSSKAGATAKVKRPAPEITERELRILDHNKAEKMERSEASKVEESRPEPEKEKLEIDTVAGGERAPYKYPHLGFLSEKEEQKNDEKSVVRENAEKLVETLSNFGIEARVDQVSIGPSITKYELQIAAGVKVSRILSLSNDLALSLASSDIRIEAPIPGKSAIGIEVPNKYKTGVKLREILSSKEFLDSDSAVPIALGKSVEGESIVASIEKMPHLLIAGATGSGKSVCINTIITSILYKSSPEEVRLILVDPKVVELSIYNGIPHLLIPVVTDAKKASGALNWAVQEMNRRYELFAENSVRDITGYNKKLTDKKLPKIVMIIDELADLMMVSSSDVEDLICRIAQMARAAGIHLILATQRPSVDVITGTIKANIPSRISFAVSSQTDSRTILDMGGAEKLLGRGDMLYYPVGASKPLRVQGAFIDDEEVERIVGFVKSSSELEYEEKLMEEVDREIDMSGDCDELLPKAIEIVVADGQASISLLQRRLKIGYARAARIVDQMEERGIIGGYEGSKPRKVLVEPEELED
ncbi:DNA translocase SpoIIIE [Andreesenia angusta]|uniref:DNA translocase SpoIIIE n=1 Tax=Andreesenia angusta TaxID=39480 RepID=A0A1S1V872_9FIRM|nr:DNA translocase FtsK [Andreesenia angusta]OHW62811.1 DNA translocase SpoIIIE [Andreesenia angusta]